MWDNTALLRNASNAMFAVTLLLVLYGGLHYLVHLPNLLPLHVVRLDGAPQRADAQEVLQAVREGVQGNLLTLDIAQLKAKIERLPWVRQVQIRREFPDRLRIAVEEHQAFAHWNNDALVNVQGEVFDANDDANLPEFIGPSDESQQVLAQYVASNEQLARINLQAVRVTESPRHAWQLRLNNGMVLELGSEQMQQRLARFVAVYPYSLAAMQASVKTVDLRYRNGFAVSGGYKQS